MVYKTKKLRSFFTHGGARTRDPGLIRPMLYRLSYTSDILLGMSRIAFHCPCVVAEAIVIITTKGGKGVYILSGEIAGTHHCSTRTPGATLLHC